uniref:Uncharacterized protein n=1 Tax=Timema tahoe TaxID=61484 RepID=A0A7R9FPC1_9NEOP|nr:unnamed protein product [Timema tahoe]
MNRSFTTISNNKPCTVVPPKDWIAADVGVDVRISDEYTKLEAELVTAVEAGAVAEAVRMEQQLEDEILVSAVRTLYKDRDDKEKLEEDKKMIAELVKRDKRAVELLSGVLGSSSGGGSSGRQDVERSINTQEAMGAVILCRASFMSRRSEKCVVVI